MRLILAEKPSVARDVARAFSSWEQKNGYIKANDRELGEFYITWCFGHLLEIDTEKIAPKGEKLPFPKEFKYRVKRSAGKQFEVIRTLVRRASEIWNFGDPEREGELLVRLVLLRAGWDRWDRTYRFWSSRALTPDVVREEIKAMRPARDYDSVFWEALARQHGDWLVGIPLSRVLMHNLGGRWSVGRVQTPTLTLLVQRELERKDFKPKPYVVIKGEFSDGKESFFAVLQTEKSDRAGGNGSVEGDEVLSPQSAEKILQALEKVSGGTVVEVKDLLKKEPPPLLHSLTTLQREASKHLRFSAQKTLNVAQKLYEKKLISYPRTESQHLSGKDRDLVKKVLAKLGENRLISAVDKVGKRVFDDSKLTDHFALIPLSPITGEISEEEKKLYHLIRRRFVSAFMDYFIYKETRVRISAGGYTFIAKGKRIVQMGWKELYGEEREVQIPGLTRGQKVILKRVVSEKKLTKPPSRYTEGSLVEKMKKLEIGTPATRSVVLESLKKRGYVRNIKGQLVPAEKGIELVKKLLEKKLALTSPQLTSEWEKKLHEIRVKNKGKQGYEEFISDIKEFVKEQARELENVRVEVSNDGRVRRKRRGGRKGRRRR